MILYHPDPDREVSGTISFRRNMMTGIARTPDSDQKDDLDNTVIISAEHLTKVFGGKYTVRAVDDIS